MTRIHADVPTLARLTHARHIAYLLAVGTPREANKKDWLDYTRSQLQQAQLDELLNIKNR